MALAGKSLAKIDATASSHIRLGSSGVPISVPTAGKSMRIAGGMSSRWAEMMTDDAKFALGF
jgi:hypothetical protein